MVKCKNCGIQLIVNENWHVSRASKYDYRCNRCHGNHNKNYYKEHSSRLKKLCRYKNYVHGGKSMSENKQCSSYLGVHVAERVLARTFKDVEVMPYGHKGYDFICNKGMKIDVKAACIFRKSSKGCSWLFKLKRNKIADYFLCIAFDNRENLNPLYLWLLPAHKFNHLTSTTISTSTISKWDDYVIDVSMVTKTCENIKCVREEFS